jgi:hypothetical protein
MTDGLGSVSYQYDPLSRMTSESPIFTSMGSAPYTLTYTYNLTSQLTNITDPWNAQVGYTRGLTGRLTTATGSGYANVSQYASAFEYRAGGAVKGLDYGTGVALELSYNNRLQESKYKLTSSSTNIPSPSMDIDNSYSGDGRLKLSTDNRDATLDRAYEYEQVGRLVDASNPKHVQPPKPILW